ncbi:hypothetical protein ELQ35_06775 [Peribacillus cavernae]|uniref:UPF0738 protein ELQ35_06775 n=1 Tax=Peribacillus cavernae TaxID=1674310 RepID=A0A3S0TY59_9BACI|nr:hypothetical protein [Peribacillus cavernae]MDQ0217509.1 hypothetical protein [Peribacillus cavernae]RUQ30051.1 hypothetical protein ELQ35_06775 [Peribacillus cavernae]
MREKITIKEIDIDNQQLLLKTEGTVDLAELTPKEQMLVDSDGAAFIYITENNDDYTYISLPETVWPHLKEAVSKKLPVVLISDDEKLELTGISEELAYLIDNIQGNSNYGEELVSSVERIFLK